MIHGWLALLFMMSSISMAQVRATAGSSGEDLIGSWKYVGYIYQGNKMPPPNPNLVLIFEFHEDGTDSLFWTRTGETGFCERHGHYHFVDRYLEDEVTWLNPNNAIECSRDPDMQMGKKTRNEATLINNQFQLNLGLGGDPFILIFDRIP